MGALIAATALDAASSWGHREGNSLLASSDGTFGPKGLSIKIASAAAVLAPQVMLRRHAILLRPFAIANAGETAFYTAAAVHNFQLTSR